METLESLHRKIDSAKELKSVVRTMKALAASNIGQYEIAVNSLGEYDRTVSLGIKAYFMEKGIGPKESAKIKRKGICGLVFGSDLGLVGQFNDSLSDFVTQSFHSLKGEKEIWAVGERIQLLLSDTGFNTTKLFSVPSSVNAITSLVGQILIEIEKDQQKGIVKDFYIFHNQPKTGGGYAPIRQQLLPLDENWSKQFAKIQWPTNKKPQVLGKLNITLQALIREYLFVSLFRACAESLAGENASRLGAMQRAEKNIDELMDNLSSDFNRLRQSSIDEELFDVISGFEALKDAGRGKK
jgi:F-type H+-transporting ATPase subunit gamma